MIKWLIKKIKTFYDSEYEGKIVIEFSIYDVIFAVLILTAILWITLK